MTVYAPPFVQITPWTKASSTVGAWTQNAVTTSLSGGNFQSPVTINNAVTYSVAVGIGTYTLTVIGEVAPDRGISTVTLGGVTVGTIDWYTVGTTDDTVKTIAAISVTSAGVVDLTFTAATKNAASSNYRQQFQFVSLHRTDDPAVLLRGVSGLPQRVDITPWGGSSYSTTGTWTRTQSSSLLGGGTQLGNGVSGTQITWKVALDAGTWNLTHIGITGANRGISTWNANGFPLGTLDWYTAGTVNNVAKSIAGLVVGVPGIYTLQEICTTKNAASSSFFMSIAHVILQRTGP